MKRKVLTMILCMSVTLSTGWQTGINVHAEEIEKVLTNNVAQVNVTTDETLTEDTETDGGQTKETAPQAGQEGMEETVPQETPEATVPEQVPEATGQDSAENTREKWWAKVEAESGEKTGKATIEKPSNLRGETLISNLDGGKNAASVTITVVSEFEDDVEMKVRYRSGDARDLCYQVNSGEEKKWAGLNSGNWNTMAETEAQTIHLTKGENKIEFFASEGANGPGIDYITFSRNGGTEQDMADKKEITVTFKNGENTVTTFSKKANEMIEESEVPKVEAPDGQHFLGWFWGPDSKYEGMFPLELSKINTKVLDSLNGNLTFTACFGKHTPANEKQKDGYRLIFDEDFNGDSLDETKWVDKYLSSWSNTADYTKGKEFHDGVMSLKITEETQPWCPAYDDQTVISGFTTGQRNGLHNWNKTNQVVNPSDTELTHINQYGYYEMRMKGQAGSSRHSAWWLLGFEDVPEESAEIDIFEVLGKDSHSVPPAVHEWNDTDAFPGKPTAHTDSGKDFNNEYHVYGFDWQRGTSGDPNYPDKIVFYVDGVAYNEMNVNIDYPMIQLLSLYEKRAGGWTGDWEWMPYPNTMDVDYVRVYKKLPQEAVAQENLQITEIRAEDLEISENKIELNQYGDYTEKNLPGTKSYVRVQWNDGVETQEPVVWDAITPEDMEQLKAGNSIEKNGQVTITSLPGEMRTEQTKMTITPVEEEVPPYTAEGMTVRNDVGYLFDGKIDEKGATSAEFSTTKEALASGTASITYDFKEKVIVDGINLWTNFGQDQGIKSFNVAVWNQETEAWETIKDENGQDRLFTLDWKQKVESPMEKLSVSFDPIATSQTKLIIKDAGLTWNSKFAMREIAFHTEKAALESLEVTPPAKVEYVEGEALNLEGMTVTAKYSDGTSANVPLENVTVSGYDANKIGEQEITITYENVTAAFKVQVKKAVADVNHAPVIEAKDFVLTVGAKFDPLQGITASDEEDGDLTKAIVVKENTVDTAKAGQYKVVYTVTDKDGAASEKTIKVTVEEKKAGNNKNEGKNKNEGVKTGDSVNIVFWGALVLLSGIAVFRNFLKKIRRR